MEVEGLRFLSQSVTCPSNSASQFVYPHSFDAQLRVVNCDVVAPFAFAFLLLPHAAKGRIILLTFIGTKRNPRDPVVVVAVENV